MSFSFTFLEKPPQTHRSVSPSLGDFRSCSLGNGNNLSETFVLRCPHFNPLLPSRTSYWLFELINVFCLFCSQTSSNFTLELGSYQGHSQSCHEGCEVLPGDLLAHCVPVHIAPLRTGSCLYPWALEAPSSHFKPSAHPVAPTGNILPCDPVHNSPCFLSKDPQRSLSPHMLRPCSNVAVPCAFPGAYGSEN